MILGIYDSWISLCWGQLLVDQPGNQVFDMVAFRYFYVMYHVRVFTVIFASSKHRRLWEKKIFSGILTLNFLCLV